MKVIGRLIATVTGGLTLASMLGVLAAKAAKDRSEPLDDPEADEVRIRAILEPMSFRSTARSFRGGTLDCWYGGGAVDLRGAVLDPDGALLRVKAIFGGAQIVVPETWRVTSRVIGIGGLGDARPPVERDETAPHLTIEGLAFFGGFGVTSEMPEAAARGLDQAIARFEARKARLTADRPEVAPAV
jgi:hypothetical protein